MSTRPTTGLENRARSRESKLDLGSPHGGSLVDLFTPADATDAWTEATTHHLYPLRLDPALSTDVELLAVGAYSPLTGFLGSADYRSVIENARLSDGTVWPIPIVLPVDDAVAFELRPGQRIALWNAERAVAVLDLEEIYPYDPEAYAQSVFGTTSSEHPGVARLLRAGRYHLGGRIHALPRPALATYPEYHLDPRETRRIFEQRGWRSVDAQRILDRFLPEEIRIQPLAFEDTFYCRPLATDEALTVAGGTIAGNLGEPWSAEIAALREQIALFRQGRLAPEKFREYRLANGIYGQRQDGVHMIRVKIPNGVLNPAQLDALAEIAERFGHGIAHLTTRQDVQYHYIRLEEMPDVLEILARVGLHSREACGNSVRNVTSCPFSGVCSDEPFPVLPYAQALARFLLRHSAGQILARKFKIAFSGCANDCAAGAIHDIGAIARVENGQPGFRLLIGGGLGAVPIAASLLSEFVPAEDILRASEAIVRVYSEHGNRRNRARARLKFVVQSWGIDRFRQAFAEKMEELSREPRPDLDVRTYLREDEITQLDASYHDSGRASDDDGKFVIDTQASANSESSRSASISSSIPQTNLAAYSRWLATATRPERDRRRRSVTVSFPLGDVRPPALRSLAQILREVGARETRCTIQQNLVLQGISVASLPILFDRLENAGLAGSDAGSAIDVLSCPGADTCNLGITTSKGLAEAISEELRGSALSEDILRGVSIKISGCPNGCGQHHIGTLGFHGIARRVHGEQAPHYQLHVGGGIDERGAFLGRGGLKIPARNVPRATHRLLTVYAAQRRESEDFAGFLRRTDPDTIANELADLLEVPQPADAPEYFRDFHQALPFTTETLGVGECAGAGTDASTDRCAEPAASLDAADRFRALGLPADVVGESRRAAYAVACILLDRIGCRTVTDFETRCEFQARFVDRGHASETWEQLMGAIENASKQREVPSSSLPDLLALGRAFLEEGRRLLEALDGMEAGASLPGLTTRNGGGGE